MKNIRSAVLILLSIFLMPCSLDQYSHDNILSIRPVFKVNSSNQENKLTRPSWAQDNYVPDFVDRIYADITVNGTALPGVEIKRTENEMSEGLSLNGIDLGSTVGIKLTAQTCNLDGLKCYYDDDWITTHEGELNDFVLEGIGESEQINVPVITQDKGLFDPSETAKSFEIEASIIDLNDDKVFYCIDVDSRNHIALFYSDPIEIESMSYEIRDLHGNILRKEGITSSDIAAFESTSCKLKNNKFYLPYLRIIGEGRIPYIRTISLLPEDNYFQGDIKLYGLEISGTLTFDESPFIDIGNNRAVSTFVQEGKILYSVYRDDFEILPPIKPYEICSGGCSRARVKILDDESFIITGIKEGKIYGARYYFSSPDSTPLKEIGLTVFDQDHYDVLAFSGGSPVRMFTHDSSNNTFAVIHLDENMDYIVSEADAVFPDDGIQRSQITILDMDSQRRRIAYIQDTAGIETAVKYGENPAIGGMSGTSPINYTLTSTPGTNDIEPRVAFNEDGFTVVSWIGASGMIYFRRFLH